MAVACSVKLGGSATTPTDEFTLLLLVLLTLELAIHAQSESPCSTTCTFESFHSYFIAQLPTVQ